jgi:hypothetical protein
MPKFEIAGGCSSCVARQTQNPTSGLALLTEYSQSMNLLLSRKLRSLVRRRPSLKSPPLPSFLPALSLSFGAVLILLNLIS